MRGQAPIAIYRKRADALRALKELVRRLNVPVPYVSRACKRKRAVKLRLNEREVRLRELVNKWLESGPNLFKLCQQEPELARVTHRVPFTLWPSEDGGGALEPYAALYEEGRSEREQAIHDFVLLLVNPEWKLLRGPCTVCGNFFIGQRNRPRVYCSRACASRFTARRTMQTRRENEKADKLRRVKAALNLYSQKKPRDPWKKWVSAREPDVTPNWITMMAKRGEIVPPTEG